MSAIQEPGTTYVLFTAEIAPATTESLLSTMAKLAESNVGTVYLLLSTPGGDVASGITTYNALRSMPFKLITHSIGNIDSIGNAIFLAGEERYACPHSTFMFHGVGRDVVQARLEEKNTREVLNSILSDQKRIGAILKERTRLDDSTIGELFREAQTKDAAYAASHGIVHDVRDVKLPPGNPIVTFVFQRKPI